MVKLHFKYLKTDDSASQNIGNQLLIHLDILPNITNTIKAPNLRKLQLEREDNNFGTIMAFFKTKKKP